MKLQDCKIEMKVKVLGKTIHGTDDHYPALQRGWGYIRSVTHANAEDTVYLTESIGGPSESGGYSPNDLEPYIEPKETEYRQLKNITPRAIYRAAPTNALYSVADSFMDKFIHFVSILSLEYEETLSFDDLVFELEVDPDLADLLIQHGFIEKVVEEKTWKSIGWKQIARLQPGIEVKRVYDDDGYEEIFTITKAPRLEYIESFKQEEMVYDSQSSFGRIDQHFITDLFNGDVYILTEDK